MSLDLEKEYNNRAAVPEHPAIIARWAAESKAYRNINPPRVIEYGEGERNTLDLFDAGPGPAVMFIHGGYWQNRAKEVFTVFAEGPMAHGINVALIGYTLAPDATLDEIVDWVAQARLLQLQLQFGHPRCDHRAEDAAQCIEVDGGGRGHGGSCDDLINST